MRRERARGNSQEFRWKWGNVAELFSMSAAQGTGRGRGGGHWIRQSVPAEACPPGQRPSVVLACGAEG